MHGVRFNAEAAQRWVRTGAPLELKWKEPTATPHEPNLDCVVELPPLKELQGTKVELVTSAGKQLDNGSWATQLLS